MRRRALTVPRLARELCAAAALTMAGGFGLVASGAIDTQASATTAEPSPPPADPSPELLATGKELFEVQCSSCHGLDGKGVTLADGSVRGPSLENAGEASAYYMLATGRMPLNDSSEQPHQKTPAYDDEQITALVAYVASLGHGPALPDVDVAGADLAAGGETFRSNCAPCHSASGAGGALSYGRAAPSLHDASPAVVGAAVRSGPGQMPVFDSAAITPQQLNELASYVQYLKNPEDPGGLPIGRVGPVPEGFVAWFFGIGTFLAAVGWIGTRSPIRPRPDAAPEPASDARDEVTTGD